MADELKSTLIRISQDDRIAVLHDPELPSQRFVVYGDGETIPFGPLLPEDRFLIARPYLVSPASNVTMLDGRQLAGLLGGLLARQSRAPGTVIDVLVKEFLAHDGSPKQEKIAVLERILIQYGDDSVQEFEGATVLFMAISNLATKTIEDRRLGSYIEQSSRYVVYTRRDPVTGAWFYYREPRIMASPLRARYLAVMDRCFETYARLVEALTAHYQQLKPVEEVAYAVKPNDPRPYRFHELTNEVERKEFQRVYTFDIRTRACDTARIVLPAATLTNMAMVANGRTYEHLLKRLYSSGVPEFIDIARRVHATLAQVIPTYVRRANPDGEAFWMEIDRSAARIASLEPAFMVPDRRPDEVDLIEMPRLVSGDDRVCVHLLAAALYPYVRCSYHRLCEVVALMQPQTRTTFLREFVGTRKSRRDRSPRSFEHGYDITVDITGNFGIFRDLHRHRMCTLLRQRLTPHLGFTVPADVEAVGFGDEVRRSAAEVTELYDEIVRLVHVTAAEYVVLFGHHVRFMLGMNLREAQHLLELRTTPQGHPDYRRICQKIHQEIRRRAPWIDETGLLQFVDHGDYPWSRAAAEARQSQKALAKGLTEKEET